MPKSSEYLALNGQLFGRAGSVNYAVGLSAISAPFLRGIPPLSLTRMTVSDLQGFQNRSVRKTIDVYK